MPRGTCSSYLSTVPYMSVLLFSTPCTRDALVCAPVGAKRMAIGHPAPLVIVVQWSALRALPGFAVFQCCPAIPFLSSESFLSSFIFLTQRIISSWYRPIQVPAPNKNTDHTNPRTILLRVLFSFRLTFFFPRLTILTNFDFFFADSFMSYSPSSQLRVFPDHHFSFLRKMARSVIFPDMGSRPEAFSFPSPIQALRWLIMHRP